MQHNYRLLGVTLFHAIFASFGDIESNILNFMGVPLKKFFRESVEKHYGVKLTEDEFELVYSSTASTMFVGLLVGGATMGYFMEKFGRKVTAIYIRGVMGVIAALCMIIGYWTTSMEFFVFGHFLQGVAGAYKMVFFIYLSECAPDFSRGICAMALGSGSSLMVLAANPFGLQSVFGTDTKWWILPAICLFMGLIHMAVSVSFPESPKHLYITEKDLMAHTKLFDFITATTRIWN
jgi:MFS family permease